MTIVMSMTSRGNRSRQVLVGGIIRDEGLGGPSLLPRDRSDPRPGRHIDQLMTLCVEYALHVWHDGLQICLDSY